MTKPIPQPAFFIIRSWEDFLWYKWRERPCFICGQFGWCEHRERRAESLSDFEDALRASGTLHNG